MNNPPLFCIIFGRYFIMITELAFVAVEFFFMVTGYYTMLEVSSEKISCIAVDACDTVVYSWNKAKKIYGLYFFALVIMFVIRTVEKGCFQFSDTAAMKEKEDVYWYYNYYCGCVII